jgi:uncharacterized membrane protein YfcA
MDLSAAQFLAIFAALFAGTMLQGAVGFGSGLLAIPLMLWAGIELPTAIAAVPGAVAVQTAYNIWRYRVHVPWSKSVGLTVWRYLGLPAGLALLLVLADQTLDTAKQVIGGAIVLVLAVQWFAKIKPRTHLHWGWTPLTGLVSGAMAGAIGMGGPPVVLWVMAHDWPSRTSRAFLWLTFMLLIPPQAALLIYLFGWPIAYTIGLGFAAAPLVIFGARLGQTLGERLNRHRLRVVALMLLLIIAGVSVVGPLL